MARRCSWRRRRGGHLDARAGAKPQLAVDYDLVAGGHTGFDQRHGAVGIGRRHFDLLHLDRTVGLDDVDVGALRTALHGGRGYCDRAMARLDQ